MDMELPDVNVLIALFDPAHIHHKTAQNWFAVARERGWATCPLTENGFLRIVTNPNYPNVRLTFREAAVYLRTLIANNAHSHQFWPDDISLCDTDIFTLDEVQGYRQLTDLYLLGLCQSHDATLVTFDGGVSDTLRAVVSAHTDLVNLLIS